MKDYDHVPVLIVDDRPENLISLEALLSDLGLDLVRALSGSEALRHILHTEFALVLLDVQMPEMDGFETAQLIRKNPKTQHLPIIFVTAGMREERHLFKGYETGAVDYLMKPIEPAFLRSKVKVFRELFQQRCELKKIQADLEMQNEKLRETYRQLQVESVERLRMLEELRKKDQMMIQQSRMAAMGEMLDNIAHQWRQPLNVLGLRVQEIGLCYEVGECTQELMKNNVKSAMDVVKHLSQTIDDFRSITAPEHEKSHFTVESVVAKTLSLVEGTFKGGGIAIDVDISGAPHVEGFFNQFSQVLLNLLINAKDACTERGVIDARITVRSWLENGKAVITVTDNAGGIADEVIEKVFDAYFTTKRQGQGSGIGLFMSKHIIENGMGGRLTVQNVKEGAEFRIEV